MKIGCWEVPKPSYPPLLWLAEWKVPAPLGGTVKKSTLLLFSDRNTSIWLPQLSKLGCCTATTSRQYPPSPKSRCNLGSLQISLDLYLSTRVTLRLSFSWWFTCALLVSIPKLRTASTPWNFPSMVHVCSLNLSSQTRATLMFSLPL